MRVAIAPVGFAALVFFWCQNAGAVATTGTVIKEAAAAGSPPSVSRPLFSFGATMRAQSPRLEQRSRTAAGSLVTQTRYHRFYWHGYRKCYRQLVIGPRVCRHYWL